MGVQVLVWRTVYTLRLRQCDFTAKISAHVGSMWPPVLLTGMVLWRGAGDLTNLITLQERTVPKVLTLPNMDAVLFATMMKVTNYEARIGA